MVEQLDHDTTKLLPPPLRGGGMGEGETENYPLEGAGCVQRYRANLTQFLFHFCSLETGFLLDFLLQPLLVSLD